MELRGQILLFTEPGSTESVRAKTKLESLLLPYVEVDLEKNPERRTEMLELSKNDARVPQIFFNATHIGSYPELMELEASHKLDELVEMVKTQPLPDHALHRCSKRGDSNAEKLMRLNEVIIRMKNSGLLVKYRSLFTVHQNVFQGKKFVRWMHETEHMSDLDALSLGNKMIDEGIIVHISDPKHPFTDSSEFYKALQLQDNSGLNAGISLFCAPTTPLSVMVDLRKCITSLHASHVTDDGTCVNYSAIKTDVAFARYVITAQKLQNINLRNLDAQEHLTLFINIYNSLVIHGIIVKGTPGNLWQRYKFFKETRYVIGNHVFSLNEIENGILRGNKRGPADLFNKPFGRGDPRLEFSVKTVDPRIHFALNCASKGCPAIRVYSVDKLESQLERATKAFLNGGGCEIEEGSHVIQLSQIFKWYRGDFGSTVRELLKWIVSHLGDNNKGRYIDQLIDSGSYKISWLDYDWSLNH